MRQSRRSSASCSRSGFDAYGQQRITDASGNITRTKSSVGFDRSFTGYQLDRESSLLYARARLYSPTLGRFISRDPIGYIFAMSLYRATFVPYRLDPSGYGDEDPPEGGWPPKWWPTIPSEEDLWEAIKKQIRKGIEKGLDKAYEKAAADLGSYERPAADLLHNQIKPKIVASVMGQFSALDGLGMSALDGALQFPPAITAGAALLGVGAAHVIPGSRHLGMSFFEKPAELEIKAGGYGSVDFGATISVMGNQRLDAMDYSLSQLWVSTQITLLGGVTVEATGRYCDSFGTVSVGESLGGRLGGDQHQTFSLELRSRF